LAEPALPSDLNDPLNAPPLRLKLELSTPRVAPVEVAVYLSLVGHSHVLTTGVHLSFHGKSR
jgi:hypothetical protein